MGSKTDFQNAKDRVRERLTKYTVKAFQMLPKMDRPRIAVHDSKDNLSRKLGDISASGYELLGYFNLDEQTWKKEYYFPMQRLINETRSKCSNDGDMMALLDREQQEINVFKTDPASCCSVFFVMRKR